MGDVRKVLYGDKKTKTKRSLKNRSKLRKRLNKIPIKTLFPPKNDKNDKIVVSFKENTVSFQDDCENLKKNKKNNSNGRNRQHGRVSLDRSIISENTGPCLMMNRGNKKSETQLLRFRRLSKVDEKARSQALVRTLSIKVPKGRHFLCP